MTTATRTLEVKVERTIPAAPAEVFDAWLDPKIPGNPWNYAEKMILNPTVDGLFYWAHGPNAHYGRFVKVDRPGRIEHTWMSRTTQGEETTVTVTFKKAGEGTLMTLVHSGLLNEEQQRKHNEGWSYFLGIFPDQFKRPSRAAK